jgi:hypothetical protein
MSSTTNFIFHYTKGYMFRPYNQVIIRPTFKLSPNAMLDGIPSCTHPLKHKITYTIQLKYIREVLLGGFKNNSYNQVIYLALTLLFLKPPDSTSIIYFKWIV